MDAATGAVGTLSLSASAGIDVTGINATGNLGAVLVWGELIPDQTPSYSTISPSQSPDWKDEAA